MAEIIVKSTEPEKALVMLKDAIAEVLKSGLSYCGLRNERKN